MCFYTPSHHIYIELLIMNYKCQHGLLGKLLEKFICMNASFRPSLFCMYMVNPQNSRLLKEQEFRERFNMRVQDWQERQAGNLKCLWLPSSNYQLLRKITSHKKSWFDYYPEKLTTQNNLNIAFNMKEKLKNCIQKGREEMEWTGVPLFYA